MADTTGIFWREGSRTVRTHGATASRPQRPYTTLGTAARSSTSAESGPLMNGGAYAARRMAVPIPMGTAKRRAIAELASVPTMNTSTPKWACTGSQVCPVMKPSPKC